MKNLSGQLYNICKITLSSIPQNVYQVGSYKKKNKINTIFLNLI